MKKLRKPPLDVEALTFRNENNRTETEKFYWLEMSNITPDRYVISTYGRLFDTKNKKQLNPNYAGNYARITLRCVDGKYRSFPLNRIIAYCFVKKTRTDLLYGRNNVHVVNWKIDDHRYCNFEWANSIEMSIYTSWHKGKQSNDDKIRYICCMIRAGYTNREIMDLLPFSVTSGELINIKTRATHTDISRDYIW